MRLSLFAARCSARLVGAYTDRISWHGDPDNNAEPASHPRPCDLANRNTAGGLSQSQFYACLLAFSRIRHFTFTALARSRYAGDIRLPDQLHQLPSALRHGGGSSVQDEVTTRGLGSALLETIGSAGCGRHPRNRNALPSTKTELSAMAPAARTGDSKMPKAG